MYTYNITHSVGGNFFDCPGDPDFQFISQLVRYLPDEALSEQFTEAGRDFDEENIALLSAVNVFFPRGSYATR